MFTNRRLNPRRQIEPLNISNMTSMDTLAKVTRGGEIVQASITGFLIVVSRDDLVPMTLRRNLTIDSIVGSRVMIHLPQMNLEICGVITRTKLLGKRGYQIAVDYTDDAPEYWRECLLDLLPSPGEIEKNYKG